MCVRVFCSFSCCTFFFSYHLCVEKVKSHRTLYSFGFIIAHHQTKSNRTHLIDLFYYHCSHRDDNDNKRSTRDLHFVYMIFKAIDVSETHTLTQRGKEKRSNKIEEKYVRKKRRYPNHTKIVKMERNV